MEMGFGEYEATLTRTPSTLLLLLLFITLLKLSDTQVYEPGIRIIRVIRRGARGHAHA